jgi:hypothetical protein
MPRMAILRSKKCQKDLVSLGPINAQANLNIENLAPFKILVTSIREQRRITDILTSWDRAVEITDRRLDQRGGLALLAGDGRLEGVRRRFRPRRGSGKARGHPRRRARADRLCWPRAGRRKAGRRLFGDSYRAGADPRSGKEADRRRHRRPGSALVRDHGHRPGGACRAEADAAAAVNRIGHAHAPCACATVGFVQVSPNSRTTIPGRAFFTVDFRRRRSAERDGSRPAASL